MAEVRRSWCMPDLVCQDGQLIVNALANWQIDTRKLLDYRMMQLVQRFNFSLYRIQMYCSKVTKLQIYDK